MDGCVNDTPWQVCEACWRNREVLRRDLPERWLRLHALLPAGAGGAAGGAAEVLSRPAPGSRPPLQVHVLDTLAMVARRLAGWANICLEACGEPATLSVGQRRTGNLLTEAVAVLDSRDEVLREGWLAGRYVATLVHVHRVMTVLIGLEPTVTRLATPCPSCGQRTVPLYRDARRAAVTCVVCTAISPDAVWIGRMLTEAAP